MLLLVEGATGPMSLALSLPLCASVTLERCREEEVVGSPRSGSCAVTVSRNFTNARLRNRRRLRDAGEVRSCGCQ